MKKILIFIDWFLPGYKAGGPVSSVTNLISHLKNDFQFWIVTRDTDYLENTPYHSIKSNEWNDFDTNTKVFYFSNEILNKKNIRKIIEETDFDTIYINGIYSWYFSILPLYFAKKKKNVNVIVSARGMLSEHAFSRKSLKKNVFLNLAKILGLYKNVHFHSTNVDESEQIKLRINKNARITAIPNLPKLYENLSLNKKEKKEGDLRIISIARISQEKNTKFALEILQNCTIGKITFDLFGSIYDHNYWNECLDVIKRLPNNIIVTHKGTVDSKDVVKKFSEYHISLMPSKGENFGHSILESFIAGTPVITSDMTPWKNLEEKQIGWDLSLDNVSSFENAINKCVKLNQTKYDKFSESVFKFAQNYISNQEYIEFYKCLFNK